jgi:hypothetical protein
LYRTLAQNTRFHTLISQLKLSSDEKKAIVESHSNGRTSSSKYLTIDEMKWTIRKLKNMQSEQTLRLAQNDNKEIRNNEILNTKRKRIISNFCQMNWLLETGKPDMKRIYSWVKQQKFKKSLNDHDSKELSVLITIVEKIKSQYRTAHRNSLYKRYRC